MYKKLQCLKVTSAMTSQDATVRFIATPEMKEEVSRTRNTFKPYTEVVNCMSVDPGASVKVLKSRVKRAIEYKDNEEKLKHTKSLSTQGQFYRSIENIPANRWVNALTKLPERVFSFIQNATKDTLPHNANLYLWKKNSRKCLLCSQDQTLQHVLNMCEYALRMRRFNQRHDKVLDVIYSFLNNHLPREQHITANLPNESYKFPQEIANTDSRPDIVFWNNSSISLVELTVAFETNFDEARNRKQARYHDLLEDCSKSRKTNFWPIKWVPEAS